MSWTLIFPLRRVPDAEERLCLRVDGELLDEDKLPCGYDKPVTKGDEGDVASLHHKDTRRPLLPGPPPAASSPS